MGDAHVYLNHTAALEQQILRSPRPFPRIVIRGERGGGLAWIDSLKAEDFEVENYNPCPKISMTMSV